MFRIFFALLTITLVLWTPLLSASQPTTVELIDSVGLGDYLRIFGSPSTAFYFLSRTGVEVISYPDRERRNIRFAAGEKFIVSDRGGHYGLVRYANSSPTALNIGSISLFDWQGKRAWTLANPGGTSFLLADQIPAAVAVEGAEGLAKSSLIFYGRSGQRLSKVDVKYFSNGRFALTGDAFFCRADGGRLLRYSADGSERREFGDCAKYFASHDGSAVAMVTDSVLTVYLDDDNLTGIILDTADVRAVRFSFDKRRVAILSAGKLEVFDLQARRLLSEFTPAEKEFRFFHLDVDPEMKLLLASANNSADQPEQRNTRGKVYLLDDTASELWSEEIPYEDWSIRYPEVRLAADKQLFSVLVMSGLRIYRYDFSSH